ncbi:hypothetical protein Cgig2_003513 [Carnegiea gigantea]|uniref:Transmembrane protein n=1 Tax=Carnegiea gigantea TaxID=171969 RepID=A0A9Q1GXK4_9CARY|nr:hypothetical protein Cgig2_003513 [Carnegiea gigantea]
MANQGAKKRKEENARHMSNLLRVIIGCNVVYILIRMIIFHSSISWKHWVGLVVTSLAYAIPYQQLANMAKPTYSDDGELIDGGFDMSTGGVCGYGYGIFIPVVQPCFLQRSHLVIQYLHDIIYITCFVQIASIISDKFWYTYLVRTKAKYLPKLHVLRFYGVVDSILFVNLESMIPAFAVYKASGFIKGFLSHDSEVEEDEKSRKKREKMEKKASRPKFVKTRTR